MNLDNVYWCLVKKNLSLFWFERKENVYEDWTKHQGISFEFVSYLTGPDL